MIFGIDQGVSLGYSASLLSTAPALAAMNDSNRPPPTLDSYHWQISLPTRWQDNDVYGHMNNVVYYALFDTIANRFLIDEGGMDFRNDPVVGYVVSSNCTYTQSVGFPDILTGALRIGRLGTTSLTYEIGIFALGSESAAAHGQFTHVFVDKSSGQSAPIPESIRRAASKLMSQANEPDSSD